MSTIPISVVISDRLMRAISGRSASAGGMNMPELKNALIGLFPNRAAQIQPIISRQGLEDLGRELISSPTSFKAVNPPQTQVPSRPPVPSQVFIPPRVQVPVKQVLPPRVQVPTRPVSPPRIQVPVKQVPPPRVQLPTRPVSPPRIQLPPRPVGPPPKPPTLARPSKIGVVFCHGKAHHPIEAKYANQANRWIYVDMDKESNPDVVGDIFTKGTLQDVLKLSPSGYDVVLEYHCPIEPLHTLTPNLSNYVSLANSYLKPGGIAIFPSLINRMSLSGYLSGISRTPTDLVEKYFKGEAFAIKFFNNTLRAITQSSKMSSYKIDNTDVYFTK